MKKFFVLALLLSSATPFHVNAALVRLPRTTPVVYQLPSLTASSLLTVTPELSATSSMERSLATHFDLTEGRTPVQRKLEQRYRAIVKDTVHPEAERRAALYGLLEELRGSLAAPRQGDLELVGAEDAPRFLDDGDPARLRTAIDKAIASLKRQKVETLPFGGRYVRRTDLLATLEDFRHILNWNLTPRQLDGVVRARFDIYRSPGQQGTGGVLFTAYNDPVFDGSLKPTAVYRFPLYRKPELAQIPAAKYDRADLQAGKLAGKGLELVYLKTPAEAYLYELEGSGLVRLTDGTMFRVRYDGTNGRKYQGLGADVEKNGLLEPAESARAKGRMLYLNDPKLAQAELARNPRVIYFEGARMPAGVTDLDLCPGRSVAVDTGYFPRDGLGFMWLDRPEFSARNTKPAAYKSVSRFIANHDTGNAIRGPGRIDIYWGHDQLAQLAAGQLRQPGSLYCLLVKGTSLLDVKPAPVAKPVVPSTLIASTIIVRKDVPRKRGTAAKIGMQLADARLVRARTHARPVPVRVPSSSARRPSVSMKRQKHS